MDTYISIYVYLWILYIFMDIYNIYFIFIFMDILEDFVYNFILEYCKGFGCYNFAFLMHYCYISDLSDFLSLVRNGLH